MSHTPGPWTNEDFEITAEDGSVICSVNNVDDFPCIEEDNTENGTKQLIAEFEANARLIADAPDSTLLLRALCLGVARWELFAGSKIGGEVCCGGMRYSTELNEFGVPAIGAHVRHALQQAIVKSEGQS